MTAKPVLSSCTEVAESNVLILYKFFLSKAYLIASNACSYLSLTLALPVVLISCP